MVSTTSSTKSKELVILFVGSNPSNSSMTDSAFHGSTKSSQILSGWVAEIKGLKVHVNVLNKKTDNNRPLKTSEIKANLEQLASNVNGIKPDRIVALGKTAAKALTLLHLAFYEMPHPSGRNRKLNDKNYEAQKVKGLVEYCSQLGL